MICSCGAVTLKNRHIIADGRSSSVSHRPTVIEAFMAWYAMDQLHCGQVL